MHSMLFMKTPAALTSPSLSLAPNDNLLHLGNLGLSSTLATTTNLLLFFFFGLFSLDRRNDDSHRNER